MFGVYSGIKRFILNAGTHWYRFLQRSDDWIMSQDYETLSANIMIILIGLLLFSAFLAWLINWADNQKYISKKK